MTTHTRAQQDALDNRRAFAALPDEPLNAPDDWDYIGAIQQNAFRRSRRGVQPFEYLGNSVINLPLPTFYHPTSYPVFTAQRALHRRTMVDIAKTFASLPKLNADGSNF